MSFEDVRQELLQILEQEIANSFSNSKAISAQVSLAYKLKTWNKGEDTVLPEFELDQIF